MAGQERAVHNLLNTLAHTLTRLERLEGTIQLYHRTVTVDIKSQVQQILRWGLLSTRCTLSLSLSLAVFLSFFLFLFLFFSFSVAFLLSYLSAHRNLHSGLVAKLEVLTRCFVGGRDLRHVREQGGDSGEEMVQAKRLLEAVGKLSVRAATVQRQKAHNFHQLFATNRAKRNNSKSNKNQDSISPVRQDAPRNIDEEGLGSELAYSVAAGLSHWTHISHLHAQQVLVALFKIETKVMITCASESKSCSTPLKIEAWVFKNSSTSKPKFF